MRSKTFNSNVLAPKNVLFLSIMQDEAYNKFSGSKPVLSVYE